MMRLFNGTLIMALAIILISANTPADNKYTLAKGYTVTITGTSNLHDWDETVKTVTGNGTIDWNTDGSFNLNALRIIMDVKSIKSSGGSTMDNNTYKALKSDAHPNIVFALKTPLKSVQSSASSITAIINLSIAGVTKAIEMTVTSTSDDQKSITFEGSKNIKMTDYGVEPPKALMGMLKTGDEITIHFKAIFSKSN